MAVFLPWLHLLCVTLKWEIQERRGVGGVPRGWIAPALVEAEGLCKDGMGDSSLHATQRSKNQRHQAKTMGETKCPMESVRGQSPRASSIAAGRMDKESVQPRKKSLWEQLRRKDQKSRTQKSESSMQEHVGRKEGSKGEMKLEDHPGWGSFMTSLATLDSSVSAVEGGGFRMRQAKSKWDIRKDDGLKAFFQDPVVKSRRKGAGDGKEMSLCVACKMPLSRARAGGWNLEIGVLSEEWQGLKERVSSSEPGER